MKFFTVSLALVLAGTLVCLAEAKPSKSRALLDVAGGSKSPVSGLIQQGPLSDLLKALQEALKNLGSITGGASQESGSSVGESRGLSSETTVVLGTPAPATSGAGSGSGSGSSSVSGSGSGAGSGSATENESRALGSILGGNTTGTLTRVLLSIIKALLNQTGLGSSSGSEMNIELSEFVSIVESLLNGTIL